MGGERASSVRQRYAGKICCECKAPLRAPHRRGERLCDRCGGAGKKRVYMHFMFRKGWFCQLLEEDLKTPLPRKMPFADDQKIWEMAKRVSQRLMASTMNVISTSDLSLDRRRFIRE